MESMHTYVTHLVSAIGVYKSELRLLTIHSGGEMAQEEAGGEQAVALQPHVPVRRQLAAVALH
jgi:hypothetical protein